MSTVFVDVPAAEATLGAVAPPVPATTDRPRVIETIAAYSETLDAIRMSGRTVGVVPTMGALHEGHRSLIRRAAAECDVVAVSIFVNPTQFGDPSDLANYPRSLDADLDAIATAGGRLVFAPSVEEMYPDSPGVAPTSVTVPALGTRWEGAARPGHFDGVATVVVKLLSAAGRCRSYFGEKDFQQLALVTRVARDLALPTQVIGCPTVRDHDGLALSSRNARLSPDQRRSALVLSRALRAGAALLSEGASDPSEVEGLMEAIVSLEPEVVLDYAAVVHADDLERARSLVTNRPLRLLVAATVGPVRLIDNLDPRRGR
jgi:pantoate--beta-alanine ligase